MISWIHEPLVLQSILIFSRKPITSFALFAVVICSLFGLLLGLAKGELHCHVSLVFPTLSKDCEALSEACHLLKETPNNRVLIHGIHLNSMVAHPLAHHSLCLLFKVR